MTFGGLSGPWLDDWVARILEAWGLGFLGQVSLLWLACLGLEDALQ